MRNRGSPPWESVDSHWVSDPYEIRPEGPYRWRIARRSVTVAYAARASDARALADEDRRRRRLRRRLATSAATLLASVAFLVAVPPWGGGGGPLTATTADYPAWMIPAVTVAVAAAVWSFVSITLVLLPRSGRRPR